MSEIREYIERMAIPEPNSGCWLWTGAIDKDGYGIYLRVPLRGRAHRFSWAEYNARPTPRDMCVCHKCDTPSCVNPDHLFLGTARDNARDCSAKGRKRGGSKYSVDVVRLVRAMAATGHKHDEIRAATGCSSGWITWLVRQPNARRDAQ